ncbi:hypothetical protein SP5M_0010 [Escherichia phage vB_EcoP_SP5M]|uniref:Uncharacterized protein n=1 Tax=Escherichia phage vB_EcoP_SP5M TaxID=2750853 RepID=A0A7D5K7V8_9CAUD|nr:hypothetical protein PP763_gp10 [Escherichia phage vB_EcoP_SP5M]QLF80737.1 hypothetical protein SP5M_0010 [Escherichia phage vB_EcoP_SP5M]
MNNLSDVIVGNEIFIDRKGYARIKLKGNNRTIVRKVYSKPFSNFSIDEVRINNKMYFIDSKVSVCHTDGKTSLEYTY